MTAKWSVRAILRDHARTLVDARTERPRALDYITFYLVPIGFGALAYFTGFRLRGVEGVLSGVSVYTALLFGLLVHVFQLRVRLLDRRPESTSSIHFIDELESNVSYTVLVGITTTGLLIWTVAITPKDAPVHNLTSAIIATLLVHLVLTLLLVLKRTRKAYRNLT